MYITQAVPILHNQLNDKLFMLEKYTPIMSDTTPIPWPSKPTIELEQILCHFKSVKNLSQASPDSLRQLYDMMPEDKVLTLWAKRSFQGFRPVYSIEDANAAYFTLEKTTFAMYCDNLCKIYSREDIKRLFSNH